MDFLPQQQPDFNTFLQSLMAPSTGTDNPGISAPPGPFGVPAQVPMQTIAQGISPQAPMPTPAVQPPAMIDQGTLQTKIAGALQGQGQITEQDKSQAILRMALAMMAAPKPGQNLASQFSEAATGTLNQLDTAKQRNQAATMQQAGLAMEVAKFQEQAHKTALDIRETELKLQYLPAKEKADAELKLAQAKNAMAQGNEANASAALKEVQAKYAGQLAQAEVNQRDALAGEARARAAAAVQEGNWRKAQINNEKVKVNISKLSDNSALVIEQNKDGVQKQYIVNARDAESVDMAVIRAVKAGKITPEQEDSYRAQLMQPFKMDIKSADEKPAASASAAKPTDKAAILASLRAGAQQKPAAPTAPVVQPAPLSPPASFLGGM